MKKAVNYLIIRDISLCILVSAHILFYYKLIPRMNAAVIGVAGIGALVWLAYYARSVLMYLRMKKDSYLGQAMKDEYYCNVMKRAGYHGYISVFLVCAALILINIVSTMLTVRVDLPYYIVCEGIVFLAILTDDISKIAQFSR